jgi:hypothetical protein
MAKYAAFLDAPAPSLKAAAVLLIDCYSDNVIL